MIFLSLILFGQRQANIWYFGNYAGVDFNSGHPVPLTNGQIDRWEGVASICDSAGNLLFYTDGTIVWNALHKIMPNGTGLLGDSSSTESAIIIPYPAHDSLYYIFTVDAEGGHNGLNYSIANMKLDNGNGDIQIKNIRLVDSVSEKVTAVRHKNGRDYWVVSHGWNTDSFFVYLVTPAGLQLPPQIFQLGTPHYDIGLHGNNAVGYMRLSPDGSKLALALQVNRIFEVYDFDNTNGTISNPRILPDSAGSPYGVEFSADSKMLYMTSLFSLYQANISYSTTDSIINSITFIDSSKTKNFFGAIQLATDGKIYLAHEYSKYLGVINNPSKSGDSCNFVLNGFYLAGRESRMGLPDFIQTYFYPPEIIISDNCIDDSTSFCLSDSSGIDSVSWNFGDPLSSKNSSTLFFPKHKFSSTGRYEIQLTMWKSGADYHKKRITQINLSPHINLGNDTLICSGDSILLDAYCSNCNYLWTDSSTNSSIWAKYDSNYIAKVSDKYTFCSFSDSLKLSLANLPDFNLGTDTGFCTNDSVKIGLSYKNATFLWNNNSTDSIIFAKNRGQYILQITDSLSCKNSDTIEISEYQLPYFSLGNDTIICPNTNIILSSLTLGRYLWNNGDSESYMSVSDSGTYWLKIIDSNECVFSDTIKIRQENPPVIHFPADTTICESNILYLKANPRDCNYLWNTGSTKAILDINKAGKYSLRASNACGTATASINVFFEYCGNIYIPNIFTPNNDGINDSFKIKGIDKSVWKLKIYNRYGQIIYKSNDYKNNWQAENNPAGVYYYLLIDSQNKVKYNGTVRVYR